MADKIFFSLATIPSRQASLDRTIRSVVHQGSYVFVYLNGYKEVPKILNYPNVKPILGKDIGDIGKFVGLERANGYCLTIDDDIIYPSDYAKRMVSAIEEHRRKSIIAVHGSVININRMNNYYKDRSLTHYRAALNQYRFVHVAGTGTVAYHTDTIRFPLSLFEVPNMADIWVAVESQRRNVPIRLIPRPALWLKDCPEAIHGPSIYSQSKNKQHGSFQTEVIKKYSNWKTL